MPVTLAEVRRYAVARTLFPSTTLARAIDRLGFVQADPIRAPARAQDLILRPRVRGYRAGDLERRYETIDVEEDVLVNYGFVPRAVQALMQPRGLVARWSGARRQRAHAVLDFVRGRGAAHPRELSEHFGAGTITNYWGGSSSATTHLLEAMHYCGLLRVARREAGVRVYAVQQFPPAPRAERSRRARIDALVDVAVRTYAPLPAACLSALVARLRYAVPRWRAELPPALQRAKARLVRERVEGIDWYWPVDEPVTGVRVPGAVRFLAPFDPLVWDRRRFEMLWGWAYRFEAYTPPSKRKLGYYALPLLWRDRVVGWGNLAVRHGQLQASLGYVEGKAPADDGFSRQLEAELERIRTFLDPAHLPDTAPPG